MLDTIAILGAGELGATLARRLAGRELARRVLLLDPDEGRARGKALDILQSGPVDGFDTRVDGGLPAALESADAVVIADPPELDAGRLPSEGIALLESARRALSDGPLIVAGGHPALLEAVVRAGFSRERLVGSAPVALAAALRQRLASDLGGRASDVAVTLFGRPPAELVAPQGSATLGGVAIDLLSPTALRRALATLRGRWPGPIALAAGAARVLAALFRADPSVLPVLAVLAGEYGHRGRAAIVPARLGKGRILAVVDVPLAPVDRVAFDNALGRG